MRRAVPSLSRTCATLLVLAAAASYGGGCGEEELPPPVVEPVAPPAAEAGEPRAEPGPRKAAREPATLELPAGGHPVVWVRRGREVELRDEPGGEVLETLGDETEFGSRTVLSVAQQRRGWAAVPTPHFENGRLAWVRLDPARLRAGQVGWSIEIDLSDYQATLLLGERRVRTFAVSVGRPGAETPTGRFAVTDTFRGGLNPVYGCCAVALTARQTRLPSGWLGGDRIAIHGTDGPLGAAVSNGCVRARDRDVSLLVDKVPPGTPVTIRQ